MHEKVNAGADIEKELVERLYGKGFTCRGLHDGYIVFQNDTHHRRTADPVTWAALLAEAGERAKLNDKWVDAIQSAIGNMGRIGDRDYFTFCLFLVFDQAQKDGLIPADPRTQQRIDELRQKIGTLKEKLATFDRLAERARGLEAQLRTVLDQVDWVSGRCRMGEPVAAVLPEEIIANARAALSQLPTPSADTKEK